MGKFEGATPSQEHIALGNVWQNSVIRKAAVCKCHIVLWRVMKMLIEVPYGGRSDAKNVLRGGTSVL